MPVVLNAAQVKRRFLVLVGLRWFPTGIALPVTVLLMLDRGLSAADIGFVTAMQGALALMLELPTGGLADVVGRRPVLLGASMFALASYAIFAAAATPAVFALAWALQGVYRALESGPLESWYVDTAQTDDPDVDLESTLSRSGTVIGLAIASGSLVSSLLVALAPVAALNPLVLPILVAVALVTVEVVMIARLVQEPPREARPRFGSTVRQVPMVIRDMLRTVRASRTLTALVVVEALWGFGSPAFELLAPIKLDVVSASSARAAELFGPMQVAGWVASATGAAAVPLVAKRLGMAGAATVMLASQATFILALGLSGGASGLAVAFVAIMTAHGGANVAHSGILHRAVTAPDIRSSMVSVNSLSAMFGGTIGGIMLGVLADATTLTSAMLVAAVAIALASPLYLIGRDRSAPAIEVREYA